MARWSRLLLLPLLVILATLGLTLANAASPTDALLFLPTQHSASIIAQDLAFITRYRPVEVNFPLLAGLREGDTLVLNLFEDTNLPGTITRVEQNGETTTYAGDLAETPLGHFVIVSTRGQIMADITAPQFSFQVTWKGVHTISQIDQAAFPAEAAPVEISSAPDLTAPYFPSGLSDDGSEIDVLVVYTPNARDAAGGTAAIQNLIALAVADANAAYLNSGVNQRLNLVHSEEVAYTESGFGNDLDRLRLTSDGYMDNVHTLRDTHLADLVSLIIEDSSSCGLAYLMANPHSSFQSWAFSVIARACAVGNHSYVHELGHNMGLRHDWFEDDNITPYTYSHGYVNLDGRWRTVMAYNDDCSARGYTCTRLQYFSNPEVSYGGAPMGVPAGTNASCVAGDLNHPDCDADAQYSLDNTAYIVSNFRVRSVAPTSTPTTTPTVTETPLHSPTPTRTPTITPTPITGVYAIQAKTFDEGDVLIEKTTFNPGETVKYGGLVENDTGANQIVTRRRIVTGPCGLLFDLVSNNATAYSGTYWYTLEMALSPAACGGIYTFTFEVTFNGNTTSAETQFTVTGSTPTPTSTLGATSTPTSTPTPTPTPSPSPTPTSTSVPASPTPTSTGVSPSHTPTPTTTGVSPSHTPTSTTTGVQPSHTPTPTGVQPSHTPTPTGVTPLVPTSTPTPTRTTTPPASTLYLPLVMRQSAAVESSHNQLPRWVEGRK